VARYEKAMTHRTSIVLMNLLLALLAPIALACSKAADQPANPEGKTMSFYSFSAAPLGSTDNVSLAKYQGKVLLVVNTAAHCGYTPQYSPLGDVDRKYKDKGFAVVGFVSDDFGHQAGTVDEIKACSLEHRATFDQFAEMHVKKGADQNPIFAWLTSQPGQGGEVKWNFSKFLVSKQGELLARWPSDVAPNGAEITAAIESALAK
jgi:glutathione peroxidase